MQKKIVSNPTLWSPSEERIKSSQMYKFMLYINEKYDFKLFNFSELHKWSIENKSNFWSSVWDFFQVIGSKGIEPYIEPVNKMPGSKFFPTGSINYAENMLSGDTTGPAIIFKSEDKIRKEVSWYELKVQVATLANFLKKQGVVKGDRIAAFMPNMPETVIIMLAASSLGAVFSSASPDFGVDGVLDRFGQIEPKVLLTTDGYWYNGKGVNITKKVSEIVKALPSLKKVIISPLLGVNTEYNTNKLMQYSDVQEKFFTEDIVFEALSLDDPLYIMFSSGTTGKPKCIVHSNGGILLKHLVEMGLHSNARENSKVFYFTTCGWMMWNWLVSGLLLKSTIYLYDGSPFYPNPEILWDYVSSEKINFMGVSAKYIDALSKEKVNIIDKYDLTNLEIIGSTGSPLIHESFDYIYNNVKNDVSIASLSGGTDIVGCFIGGNPMSSVRRGEIQGPILGMDVHVYDDDGNSLKNEKGELVCIQSFPTMPLYFWNDKNNEKYHDAYFDKYPNIWCHGDYILKTENNGFIIFGRSDATLNPGGVRIGTAEIYRQVEQIEEVLEGLVVGQMWQGDTRVILFIRLNKNTDLTQGLIDKIKSKIRFGASPRHVPVKIIVVNDIPRTKSGKIAELAVRDLIHNKQINNQTALANPECLDEYKNITELNF
ncbi:acetoacetate--CoA ligase [Alphaproteobacteria bacterium]|nr:acetoacetate--CoA ligase [Alphaproteobacteria bacterium]MDC1085848.1 acetoacetate--CoA ligase [Alphaproteobacteria bacterium]